jgi:4-hydroxybenzoate polyprenyltransferase
MSSLTFYSFYSYAHQDKVDDAKLGLKSTALYFGDNTKPILHGVAACAGIGWLAACHDLSPISYIGLGSAYAHLVWQIQTADLGSPENLAHRFRSNQMVGGLVFVSIVTGNAL